MSAGKGEESRKRGESRERSREEKEKGRDWHSVARMRLNSTVFKRSYCEGHVEDGIGRKYKKETGKEYYIIGERRSETKSKRRRSSMRRKEED